MMQLLKLVASLSMISGAFLLLNLSLSEFTDSLFRRVTEKPHTLREMVNEVTHRKRQFILRRQLLEVQNVLELTGRRDKLGLFWTTALVGFALGCALAALMGNLFLVPVLAVGFLVLPLWYITLTQSHYKKDVAAELETALSIITTAYLRTEDLQTAVEENLRYLNPPVQDVFTAFLTRVQLIDPDIHAALLDLRSKIENNVFQEWVDAMVACQDDSTLKCTLQPIVSKLSDLRIVNGELENIVYEPRKEFVVMVLFVLGNVPLLRLLNEDWYDTLLHTLLGQIVMALCGAVIFVSTAFVLKLTRPIEYRR